MRQIQRETGESLVFFQNTNPKLCIMIIYLFFDLLDQRGYQRWNLLDLSWKKRPGYVAATAWNREISCDLFFKTLIELYLFCSFVYFLLTVSKSESKAIFLDMTFKNVGLWVTRSLKQRNHLQNLTIANHIIFVLSPVILFYLMHQKRYQR